MKDGCIYSKDEYYIIFKCIFLRVTPPPQNLAKHKKIQLYTILNYKQFTVY